MRSTVHVFMLGDMKTPNARERMLAGVPGTASTLDCAGIATRVLDVGDGPPLLLIHGGIECGGAMWSPVLPQISKHNRVVVPDVPGLGESAPAPNLDVETFSRWLAGVIDQTGLECPAMVAHSLLGSMALRCAGQGHDLVGRLVVCAAPAVGPYRMPLRLRYLGIRFALRPTPRNAERLERFALLDRDATRQRDPDWFDAFSTYTRARATVPHVKRTMRQLLAAQTKPVPDTELARITIPTSLLWGRADRMVPPSIGEAAASRHDWPVHIIDGAAHAPHIEQPGAFVAALAVAGVVGDGSGQMP